MTNKLLNKPPCTSQISRSCSPSLKGPVIIIFVTNQFIINITVTILTRKTSFFRRLPCSERLQHSPGRYSFFVLNEYFFELNTGKNPVLNNIFELNFFGNSKMNIFWIEYFWKFKFWIILWIECLPKNKWMNKSLNRYLSFYIEWI